MPGTNQFTIDTGQGHEVTGRAAISGRAADLAAAIGLEQPQQDAAMAGHPHVAVTMGTQPQAASGFVRWRDAIGCNALGAPVIACHWGPAPGGQWLAWWADGRAMAAAWAAEARADGQHVDTSSVPQIFGQLWYDHQDLLRPRDADTRDGSTPGPEPAAGARPSGTGAGTPGLVLLRTTLATWWLLTGPGAGVQLSQQPVPAAERKADRAAGLHSGTVTVAAAAGSA
jgi:hypothetical protein